MIHQSMQFPAKLNQFHFTMKRRMGNTDNAFVAIEIIRNQVKRSASSSDGAGQLVSFIGRESLIPLGRTCMTPTGFCWWMSSELCKDFNYFLLQNPIIGDLIKLLE